MRVRQNAFLRFYSYDRMIKRYVFEGLETEELAKFTVRHGFIGAVEVALDVFAVKWIIDSPLLHAFNAVKMVPKSYIQASLTDVLWVEWMTDNVAFIDGLGNITITVYAHSYYSSALTVFYRAA